MTMQLLGSDRDEVDGTPKLYERRNPVTGAVASIVKIASTGDALRAVEAAQKAFPIWSSKGPDERRTILMRTAEVMERRAGEFVSAMMEETGVTKVWAGFNVRLGLGVLREAAAMTTQIRGEVIPANKPGTLAMSVARPHGVCLGIAPWNAPVILALRAVAMPLACGNTVVLKAAEWCPRTHQMIGECFVQAGLPEGAINVITCSPENVAEVVRTLIEAPDVRHVNFTGSTGVGRIIGRLAGENLKPALLELGGKAPFLVLESADIEGAVNAAIFGAFMNQGQICMSTERIIVVDAVAEAFVKRLAVRASVLPYGDPSGDVVLGSLISSAAAEKMDNLIADAVSKGAKVIAGGERDGTFHSATLLDGVTPAMRIYAEESFGPVKSVVRVKDVDEAVRVANDTEYGLSAAVFTQDIKQALDVANRLHSGICHINGPTVSDEPQMPFGGVKASGHGRFGGKAAVAEFTSLRWITIEDPGQHYPF